MYTCVNQSAPVRVQSSWVLGFSIQTQSQHFGRRCSFRKGVLTPAPHPPRSSGATALCLSCSHFSCRFPSSALPTGCAIRRHHASCTRHRCQPWPRASACKEPSSATCYTRLGRHRRPSTRTFSKTFPGAVVITPSATTSNNDTNRGVHRTEWGGGGASRRRGDREQQATAAGRTVSKGHAIGNAFFSVLDAGRDARRRGHSPRCGRVLE